MNTQQVTSVLHYLGVDENPPTLSALDALLSAYTRRVPWESISRIARKARSFADAPLMPSAFWASALAYGTGGTCYESNYAFLTLLRALGYDGYLTINNMNEKIGCHSAIMITLDGISYLVDVGMPFPVAIPVRPNQPTSRLGEFHTHLITPQGADVYLIERDNHPSRYCYHLVNQPIAENDYQQILINDYGDGGLFLDRAIIVKVIQNRIWRFDSASRPFQIEIFTPFSADKAFHFLGKDIDSAVDGVAYYYGISAEYVRLALEQVVF